MINILIAGCGRIGLRYLEGINKINQPLNIHIYDISKNSIEKVIEFENKKLNKIHKLTIHHSIILSNMIFKLVIVSSTADNRSNILNYIHDKIDYEFCILEKPLSQSLVESEIIYSITLDKKVWVNTPRTTMLLYKKIKSKLQNKSRLKVDVIGDKWGLCCNSVHYIDLLAWLTDSSLVYVSEEKSLGLEKWYESKRKNFYDVCGVFNLKFADNSELNLNSKFSNNYSSNNDHMVIIKDEKNKFEINELTGDVMMNNKFIFNEALELQSDMTENLVLNIINSGECDLVELDSHKKNYDIFLKFLIDKYNSDNNLDNDNIPIT